jgi:hypothetical protein
MGPRSRPETVAGIELRFQRLAVKVIDARTTVREAGARMGATSAVSARPEKAKKGVGIDQEREDMQLRETLKR